MVSILKLEKNEYNGRAYAIYRATCTFPPNLHDFALATSLHNTIVDIVTSARISFDTDRGMSRAIPQRLPTRACYALESC